MAHLNSQMSAKCGVVSWLAPCSTTVWKSEIRSDVNKIVLMDSSRNAFELANSRLHRRSQDFVWGALFFPEKADNLFSRRPKNTRWNYLNNLFHSPDLPNLLKNLTLALPREGEGGALCLGVHLQLSPVNFFSALGGERAPLATPMPYYCHIYSLPEPKLRVTKNTWKCGIFSNNEFQPNECICSKLRIFYAHSPRLSWLMLTPSFSQ